MNQTPGHTPLISIATTPTPTWAAARLRLGQTNVGFWVIAATVVWFTGPWAIPTAWTTWALVVVAYALVQMPFDVVGGYILPRDYGRSDATLGEWLTSWARGVALQTTFLIGAGFLAMAVASLLGTASALVALWGLGLGLVATQRWWIQRLVHTRTPNAVEIERIAESGLDPARVDIAEARDRSFVGGWVGPRGMERLVLPASWLHNLDASCRLAVLRRRYLARHTGARAQGALVASLFQAVGLGFILWTAPGLDLATPTGLLQLSAGSTLWAFLGVLTLPSLSRHAVYALDRVTTASGDTVPLETAIELLDLDQEDEPRRVTVTEAIFHPVPASQHRITALRWQCADETLGFAPWRAARMSLWTGWASLSWLSRAVHCNIGRTELWVAYPGD